jgi:EAL and modified HD-GYP domain-containing signal transduction protein
MFDGLITRTPIFTRSLDVFGYELRIGSAAALHERQADDDARWGESLLSASRELPLDELTGPAPALICLPPSLLPLCGEVGWPKGKIVLETSSRVIQDDSMKRIMTGLAREGYIIALSDPCKAFPELKREASFASIWAVDASEAPDRFSACPRSGDRPKLLVENLQTDEQYRNFQSLGFDYFEGDFFLHPRLMHGCEIPANRLAVLHLLARLQDPAITIAEIEDLFRQDLTLSYKLLRLLNSAYFGLPNRVDSIRRAVIMFGLERIKNWAAVVLVNAVDFRPRELLTIAMVRARACETLARDLERGPPEAYYLAGLFSLLDAIMDAPMKSILERLNLTCELNHALLDGSGALGEVLKTVEAYERFDFLVAPRLPFSREDIPMRAFLEAIQWADEANRRIALG